MRRKQAKADTGLSGLAGPPVIAHSRQLGLYVLFLRTRTGPSWTVYRQTDGRVAGTYYPSSGRVLVAGTNTPAHAADWKQALALMAS